MKFASTILLISSAILLTGNAAAGPTIVLKVNPPPAAWSTVGIGEKLTIRMSRDSGLRVIRVDEADDALPKFPADRYNLDSLVNWGLEVGGQYLMLVDVHHERLERRKTWQVPLFFHKYVTMGVIDGEFRLIDLIEGELLVAKPFRREQEARRIFQASPDDDINDPDLHMTAPGKQVFFDQLENSLCDQLLESIGFIERGDDGE